MPLPTPAGRGRILAATRLRQAAKDRADSEDREAKRVEPFATFKVRQPSRINQKHRQKKKVS